MKRLHKRNEMERLHKQGFRSLVKMSRLHCITPWQGRKPPVLSEELLLTQKREVKTCGFVIFFARNSGKKIKAACRRLSEAQ